MSNFYLNNTKGFYGASKDGFRFSSNTLIQDGDFELMTFETIEDVIKHLRFNGVEVYINAKKGSRNLYTLTDDGKISNFATISPIKTLTIVRLE